MLCIGLIAVSIGLFSYYSTDRPLKMTYEISGTGVGPGSTCVVAAGGVKTMPYSFDVGRVNPMTLHSTSFFTSVREGETLMFGFKSSDPVDMVATLGIVPECGFGPVFGKDSEILVKVSDEYCFFYTQKVHTSGVITFCFQAEPDVLARVTMMGVRKYLFEIENEFDENIPEIMGIAKAFLTLNDVDFGKYLDHSVEYGVPNYFWHKEVGI